MRFGIKTVPEHTSWGDMLDVWRAADEIELFETAWNFDHEKNVSYVIVTVRCQNI